jgi:hypothetical protein
MRSFLTPIVNLGCVWLLALGAGCDTGGTGGPSASVTLRFTAQVDGQPLRLGSQRYTSPTGSGEFTVEDFKMYISNVILRNLKTGSDHVEKDSYHLVHFGGESNHFDVVLEGVDVSDHDTVEFAIGVDPVRNTSIENLRDLNPNNQMAWNWDVGYKFVLLEGTFYPQSGGTPIPLVYHVGYSENYKELSFSLDEGGRSPSAQANTTLTFEIELMEMFRNPQDIDFNVLPSVKFDKGESKMFADNYADMIRLENESRVARDR